ncbi:hypothetical protein [Paenibacillus paridis]|uniref:hypothetical protein n=1 Tax=Paenibacillus paridis TaxID=2583376 RepID=UPI00111D7FBC|nr:hypothetical protein [Paenibacillus paridis]
MRRYWFSIALLLLSVSGIGTYYFVGILNHLPKFQIETVQGNAKEGAAVVLSGSYYGDMRSEFLEVSVKGSKYYKEKGNFRTDILQANSWFYENLEMQQLLKDHKTFMRGKDNVGGFYRDDEIVIYADLSTTTRNTNAPHAKLQLSFLDEESEKVVRFKSIALGYSDDIYAIEDVQRVENEAHILFRKYSNQKTYELVYVFDLKTGKQLRQVDVSSQANERKGQDVQLTKIQNKSLNNANDTIFFVGSTGDGEDRKVFYYSYSYLTGILTEREEPLWEGRFVVYGLQNELIYYAEIDPHVVTLSVYNTETNERKRSYATVTAEQLGVDEIKAAIIESDRAYLYLIDHDDTSGVAVLNLEDGKLLFKGFAAPVSGEELTEEEQQENLHLNNINIVQSLEN